MKPLLRTVIALLWMAWLPGLAAAQPPAAVCSVAPEPGVRDFVIDARRGSLHGARHYRQNDQVRVVVVNKNPYLFEYRLSVEAAPVAGPNPADFLALFGVTFNPEEPAAKKPEGKAPPGTAPGVKPAATCAALPDLVAGEAQISAAFDAMAAAWKNLNAVVKKGTEALDAAKPVFADAQVLCGTLRDASTTFALAVKDFKFEPKGTSDAMDVLRATATVQAERIAKVADDEGCQDQLARFRLGVSGARAEAEKIAANLTKAAEAAKGVETAKKTVASVLANPESFTQVEWLPASLDPTDITLTLARRSVTPESTYATVVSTKLNVGGRARFAVSGGWAAGWVRRIDYIALDGQPLAADGKPAGDTIVPIVGTSENSAVRSGPALLGHIRMAELRPGYGALHATLGLTPQSDGSANRPEILAGLSWSFANETGFVSVLAYRGWRQRLEGSYYVGKALPEGSTTIPKALDEVWSIGVALSMRIK